MAATYTHKEMLIACEDGDHNTLEDCLKQGLPVNGHPLDESPLWALSIGFDDKIDDAELDLDYYVNKFDCFIALSDQVDFSEHEYAALKNMHQQNSIFKSGVIYYLKPQDVLNVFAFTLPEDQLLIAADPFYAEHFCRLIDKHLEGEIRYEDKTLSEAFFNIGLRCANGVEERSILMAKKMIDNGLRETRADDDYIQFSNIISSNYKSLLNLLIESGETEGVYFGKQTKGLIEGFYCTESLDIYRNEDGALYHLLRSLPVEALHDMCTKDKVLDYDNAALVKRVIIEKDTTSTYRGTRSRLSL